MTRWSLGIVGVAYLLSITGASFAGEGDDGGGSTVSNYCIAAPNSAGPGATMGASGSTSVELDELVLHASGGVPQEFGLFFYGREPLQLPFGEGWLCVGGAIFQLLPARRVDRSGVVSRPLDLDRPPANSGPGRISPGDTCYFQLWYRDAAGGPSGFNLSDGLRVSFLP